MTTTPNHDSLPDGISMANLESLMNKAKPNPSNKSTEPVEFEGMTEAQVIELAEEMMGAADKRCPHPILAKVVMMMVCQRMTMWHTQSGAHVALDSKCEDETFVHWLRDAGKFQAIYGILESIQVCDDDFTFNIPSSNE